MTVTTVQMPIIVVSIGLTPLKCLYKCRRPIWGDVGYIPMCSASQRPLKEWAYKQAQSTEVSRKGQRHTVADSKRTACQDLTVDDSFKRNKGGLQAGAAFRILMYFSCINLRYRLKNSSRHQQRSV